MRKAAMILVGVAAMLGIVCPAVFDGLARRIAYGPHLLYGFILQCALGVQGALLLLGLCTRRRALFSAVCAVMLLQYLAFFSLAYPDDVIDCFLYVMAGIGCLWLIRKPSGRSPRAWLALLPIGVYLHDVILYIRESSFFDISDLRRLSIVTAHIVFCIAMALAEQAFDRRTDAEVR